MSAIKKPNDQVTRRPSLAERRAALGLSSPSAEERRETLAENLEYLGDGSFSRSRRSRRGDES